MSRSLSTLRILFRTVIGHFNENMRFAVHYIIIGKIQCDFINKILREHTYEKSVTDNAEIAHTSSSDNAIFNSNCIIGQVRQKQQKNYVIELIQK